MQHFVWDGSLRIGHEEIDRQHEKLVGLAARLEQSVAGGEQGEAVMRCLTQLYLYANEHFREEEALLEAMGCPELARHQAMHRDFVRQVDELVDRSLDKDVPYGALLIFLEDWLNRHIQGEDARLLGSEAAGPESPCA